MPRPRWARLAISRALAKAAAEQARADAELRVADAAVAAAVMRAERAAGAVARMASERDALGDEAACGSAKKSAESSVATLQKHLQENTEASEAAETRRTELIAARDGTLASLYSSKAEVEGMLTEQNALERSHPKGDGAQAINRLKDPSGPERALASA